MIPSRRPAHRSAYAVALVVAVATVACAVLLVEQRWSRSPSALMTVSTDPKEAARAVADVRMDVMDATEDAADATQESQDTNLWNNAHAGDRASDTDTQEEEEEEEQSTDVGAHVHDAGAAVANADVRDAESDVSEDLRDAEEDDARPRWRSPALQMMLDQERAAKSNAGADRRGKKDYKRGAAQPRVARRNSRQGVSVFDLEVATARDLATQTEDDGDLEKILATGKARSQVLHYLRPQVGGGSHGGSAHALPACGHDAEGVLRCRIDKRSASSFPKWMRMPAPKPQLHTQHKAEHPKRARGAQTLTAREQEPDTHSGRTDPDSVIGNRWDGDWDWSASPAAYSGGWARGGGGYSTVDRAAGVTGQIEAQESKRTAAAAARWLRASVRAASPGARGNMRSVELGSGARGRATVERRAKPRVVPGGMGWGLGLGVGLKPEGAQEGFGRVGAGGGWRREGGAGALKRGVGLVERSDRAAFGATEWLPKGGGTDYRPGVDLEPW